MFKIRIQRKGLAISEFMKHVVTVPISCSYKDCRLNVGKPCPTITKQRANIAAMVNK